MSRRYVVFSAAALALVALVLLVLLRESPTWRSATGSGPGADSPRDPDPQGRPGADPSVQSPVRNDADATPGEDAAKAPIEGEIVNDIGQPIPDATVIAIDPEGTPRARVISDRDGRFRFDDLGPGRWRLDAVSVGHASGAEQEVMAPGFARIELQRHGGIRFDLRPPARGEVPSHATVHLTSDRGTGIRVVVPRDEEAFLMRGAPPGGAEISIRVPGFVAIQVRCPIQAGEVADLGTLELSVGVMLSGRIEDANGEPVYALEARIDGEPQGTFSTRDGAFTLGPVAPGAVTIRIAGGMRYLNADSVIQAGKGTAPVVIRVRKGALLQGRVGRADGSVDPRASLRLIDKSAAAQPVEWLGVDAKGRFMMRLAPGSYRLELVEPGTNTVLQTRDMELGEGEAPPLVEFILPSK